MSELQNVINYLIDRLATEIRENERYNTQVAALKDDNFRLEQRLLSLQNANDRLKNGQLMINNSNAKNEIIGILSAARKDMRITTIKHIRALTGMSLKEAKDIVDEVMSI